MEKQEERYNKLRRQKINVMLNEEERRIITEKAIKYGFGDCLAEYIRAACIYENIYIEDVEGKTEICDVISKFIETLHEILKEQKAILKNLLLDKSEVEIISRQNNQIMEMIDTLSRLVVSILSVNTEQRIQQRLGMLDKYKLDENFFNKIITNNNHYVVVRPSNLKVPNQKFPYIVYLSNHSYTFDLNYINKEEVASKINSCRDIAMKKNLLISFKKEDDFLMFGVVMSFKDYNVAKKFANDIGTNEVITLFDDIEGDSYSNNS